MDKIVYIDESGSPDFGEDHYVLAACFTTTDTHDSDLNLIENIREMYFSKAEMKSSKIGGNLIRRAKIAKTISQINSRFEVLVIKKNRLSENGGLRFKKSMYKFCQRRLFEKIYRGMSNIGIVMDSYGDTEFREGFYTYIEKHYQPTLFSSKSVSSSTPIIKPLLQASDFIAGTVRRFFNGDDDDSAYDILKQIINNLEVWPRSITDEAITAPDEKLDKLIRNHCTYAAEEFLVCNLEPMLSEVVQFLLYSEASDHEGFIYGDVILAHIQSLGLASSEKEKSWFRQSIIAPLREHGVLIAASRDGYKIPETQRDLEQFVGFVNNKTMRYLDRVVMMRDSIYYGTGFKYDMLSSSPDLQKLLRPLACNETLTAPSRRELDPPLSNH